MSISGGDCLTAINGILCWQGGLPHRAHCGTQAFPLFQDQIYLRTRHSMQFGLQEVMNNLSSCFLRPHLEYAFSEVSMSGGEKKKHIHNQFPKFYFYQVLGGAEAGMLWTQIWSPHQPDPRECEGEGTNMCCLLIVHMNPMCWICLRGERKGFLF